MRPTAVLLAAAALALSPTAALASGSQPAPPVAQDPCAPVDGQVPLLCQSGSDRPADRPALQPASPPDELPRTGSSAPAAGAVLLLLAGGGVLLGQRHVPPRPGVR